MIESKGEPQAGCSSLPREDSLCHSRVQHANGAVAALSVASLSARLADSPERSSFASASKRVIFRRTSSRSALAACAACCADTAARCFLRSVSWERRASASAERAQERSSAEREATLGVTIDWCRWREGSELSRVFPRGLERLLYKGLEIVPVGGRVRRAAAGVCTSTRQDEGAASGRMEACKGACCVLGALGLGSLEALEEGGVRGGGAARRLRRDDGSGLGEEAEEDEHEEGSHERRAEDVRQPRGRRACPRRRSALLRVGWLLLLLAGSTAHRAR